MSNGDKAINFACRTPISSGANSIRLGHGSGGTMTSKLISELFLPILGNEVLCQLDDAAIVKVDQQDIVVTTDAYVVSPIVFPGGDIGSLSVHGTINDLAMKGAKPLFITATFILEEGLAMEQLAEITRSFSDACQRANVILIAADTKVVNKGAADKIFISTCGIGRVIRQPAPAAQRARPGQRILISGDIGRHGTAIMCCREGLDLETTIVSDSQPLADTVASMMEASDAIHCLRDITRGGLASVLNELASSSNVGMSIMEDSIPVHAEVRAVCELLGLDPLYVACEGRFVAIVSADVADTLICVMNEKGGAGNACAIGEVVADHPGRVVLKTRVGGKRIVDKLAGEQLPRIC
jgi:hydrogenase expression/formation protein HypE